MSHLMDRKKTHFSLWRPAVTDSAPRLVIGVFKAGNPPQLEQVREFPLAPSPVAGEIWEAAADGLGLTDGQVYHYWFRVTDSFPGDGRDREIDVTDPFATTVDWRLMSARLPAPYTDQDRDPAGVVLFRGGVLIPCDPGGELADWTGDVGPAALPANNRLVIYELPTRWTLNAEGNVEMSAGTFRDVLALVEPQETGANFDGMAALGAGHAHLRELGVNAIELLPPADSFVGREWGYATSNYLAADYDLGFPEGHASPTATTDLARLVGSCHRAGMRFFTDVVMAFATRAAQENVNFLDFHVLRGTGDPEEQGREDFGGKLMKYNYRVNGYDPVTGRVESLVPARQWMKIFLDHWLRFYRVDGLRMDSVVNFGNWDFIEECTELARAVWRERWEEAHGGLAGADERFLTVAEELAVPMELLRQNRVDGLWNEHFKGLVREAVLGGPGMSGDDFGRLVEKMVDCRRLGFRDGAEAVNYITSHDVEGYRNERLYSFLENNGVRFKERQIKLAFVCLLTAVGIPMILAGEEFADEHDLPLRHPEKQTDPVNFRRLEEPWRRSIFDYVARLVKLRTSSDALAVNDTRILHRDFTPGRRIVAWERGLQGSGEVVVVVANFSAWGTENPGAASAEYRVAHWPSLPPGRVWREVTQQRDVPVQWAGREPLYPWEAKVYAMEAAG